VVNLKSAPGERYSYSNIGYEILGDVVAKASKGTFEDFVAITIFRPLGMTSSTFLLAGVPRDRLTVPCVLSKDGLYVPAKDFPYHRAHAPSSTLYSNVADMLRWLRANINEGELDGRRILGARAVREMLTDGVARSLPPTTPIRSIQHLGWSTLVLDGVSVHGHSGHDTGFRSMMVFTPQERAAVVIMTNGDAENVKVDQLGLQLLGMTVGKDWSRF
jgi:CubicO group peptidase (beta-lactamase class C family)